MTRGSMPPPPPPPLPSYEDAGAELSSHFELLSMSSAQLEHPAKVEQLEHERRMRAAETAQVASRRPDSKLVAATTTLSTPSRLTCSGRRTVESTLHTTLTTLTTISSTPIPHPVDSITLSRNAFKLRALLLKIMHRDYASPSQAGRPLTPLTFSWTERHMDAIYYSQSWRASPYPAPPVLTTRLARLRTAALELGISFEIVEKLILQHYPQSRRRKFGTLHDGDEVVARRDWRVLAVEMCRDAYQVILIVAVTDEEVAELLEGVVSVAKREGFFGAGEGFREVGSAQGVKARARWYRERWEGRIQAGEKGRGMGSG